MMNKKIVIPRIFTLCVLILVISGCGKENDSDKYRAKRLVDYSLEELNDYEDIEFDALGHYALSCLYMYKSTGGGDYLYYSKDIIDYLIKNGDKDDDGFIGWGLRFPYDAFSDGTVNDINAEYTYTTSVIGFAICEIYNETKDDLYKDYIEQIRRTLLEHIGFDENEKGICFWYSSSENDKIYTVHNVNVYTMQFLADYDDIYGLDILSDEIIEKITQFEENTMISSGKWLYCEERDSKNDLVHWCFSVTSYYRVYELTQNKRYLNLAEESLNAIKEDYFVNYDIMDDSSHLWGIPEVLISLCYEKKYSNGQDLENVLINIDKNLDKQGRYVPALGIVNYESDTLDNHRAMSWYAYAFAYISYVNSYKNY